MKIKILQQAINELDDAIQYYENIQNGLGLYLLEEFDEHVKWISENVEVPNIRKGGYRRLNLRRFPFYIAYMAQNDVLWILAMPHSKRNPKYWIKRKP